MFPNLSHTAFLGLGSFSEKINTDMLHEGDKLLQAKDYIWSLGDMPWRYIPKSNASGQDKN